MTEEISIVKTDNKLPLDVSIVKFDTYFRHMHSYAQLLLILDGECDIFIGENCYHGQSNDMVVINPLVFHHLISEHYCTLISVTLNLKGFGLEEEEINSTLFNLNTMEQPDNPRYDQIRYLIYSIIKYNTMENFNSIYTNRAISFSFFAQLMNDFGVSKSLDYPHDKGVDTFTRIGAWINDHYKEKITLTDICNQFNYTPSYLSRLIKQSTGHSFVHIYDVLRVNYSLNDLLRTNKTIEEISSSHGFENARSYVRAFNSIHNMNPSEYRNKFSKTNSNQVKIDRKLLKKNALDKILSKYDAYGSPKIKKKEEARSSEIIARINYKGSKEKLENLPNKILEVPGAGDLFSIDSYNLLKEAKKDLNYEYILIPKILSHATYMLAKNESGQWQLNFMYFDKMLQKIFSLKAKPYLIFEYESHLLSSSEYFALLLQILEYLSLNYQDKAKDMMISFSLTRDTLLQDDTMFNKERLHIYLDLFKNYKKQLPGVKLGTPVFYRKDILENDLYFRFLEKLKEYECPFDFIPIRYTYDFIDGSFVSKDKSEFKHFIKYLKDNDGYYENKMYFQGISFTNGNSLLNDTLYAASYIIKNYIDNCDKIASYSKKSLQDKVMISAYDPNPFHGESGLVTYNGIKKASYNAYVLLSKLQNNILKRDKYYLVTTSEKKIVILINNYNHYSDLFAEKEYFEITNLNRYCCFPKSANLTFKFEIENLNFASYNIKISSINRHSGSSYDKWFHMGAKKNLTNEELKILKNLSDIRYEFSEEIITKNKLSFQTFLEPHECKLIEIDLIDK